MAHIGTGNIIGRKSGINWSRWWATRTPSNLSATTISSTQIDLEWDDAADASDGLRIYISTDNVTFIEQGTANYGDEAYSATGLTRDTTYYFRLVAYKGTHESDYIEDFDTTTILLSDVANMIFWYDSVNIVNSGSDADIATDLSGVTGNLQAPAAANRPAIVADSLNGYPALSFDGTTDRLIKADAAERSLPYTVFAIAKFDDNNADSAVIGGTTSTYSAPIYMRVSSGNKLGIFSGTLFTNLTQVLGSAIIFRSIVNGATSTLRAGDNEITGNAGTNTLKGLEWGGYANLDGQCAKFLGYEVAGYSGAVSAENQVKISRALCIKYAVADRQLFDGVFHNSVSYLDLHATGTRSPQSEFKFQYEGTTLFIKANPSIAGISTDAADIGIFIDGVYNQSITYTGAADTGYKEITLPAGKKNVTIVEGQVTIQNWGLTVAGSWITDILADDSFKKIPITNVSEKLVFFGDSITIGQASDNSCYQSYPRLFVAEDSKEVAVLGWGYNRLEYVASDGGKLALTVGWLTSLYSNVTEDKKLIILLGTNDYGASTAAATFGGWYADLLDAINASDSDIHVYCISPLRRNTDPALLADYRTQVQTVCAARPTYTTYINGYNILDLTDLDDGVHPTTAGHQKIKDAIESIIL